MPKLQCGNPNVIKAEGRLNSYRNKAWYQSDDGAMCFLGICGHRSYNAWVKATDQYINEELVPHYKKIFSRAEGLYGGAPFPIELSDRLNKVNDIVHDWDEAGFKPDKTWSDEFRHPFVWWWRGEIKQIIDYFDEAACAFDELDDIAINVLDQPSLAEGAPVRELKEIEGGYLGGHGGESSKNKSRSAAGTAAGIIALGAAGYFTFKVLTE